MFYPNFAHCKKILQITIMKIGVIGTGYVGLVTGTCLSETGNQVICVDVNKDKVESLNRGEIPIYEPGLEVLFERNKKQGRLQFTTDLKLAVEEAELIFFALPTPPDADGAADLQFVLSAAKDVGKLLKRYTIIVNKSTVPVGTAAKVRDVISREFSGEFDVVSNPEFLREGVAVEDFMKPDRIVIGTTSQRAAAKMEELYLPYVRQGNPILVMDEASAELTKYAANSFLAMKISYMNEISRMCELTGADVDMVRRGIGADDRIGKRFLFSGIGYGGSCFPKDVSALVNSASKENYDFKILRAVLDVNEQQKKHLVSAVENYFNGDLKNKKIAMWGLAFKPDTDDIRDAPALVIIDELLKRGVVVTAFDPVAMKNVEQKIGNKISFAEDKYACLSGAECLVICTEWAEFRNPDFEVMKKEMKLPVIFDGRNLFDLKRMENAGFYYHSIGRKIIRNER